MASGTETQQQKRTRFLEMAAAAESTAFKLTNQKDRDAWAKLARQWTAMANSISIDE